jgi:ketol-acid reductoisomerase
MEEFVRERLEGIQSGEFAEEWREEQRKGTPHLEELFEKYRESEMIQREQTIIETLGLDESVAED